MDKPPTIRAARSRLATAAVSLLLAVLGAAAFASPASSATILVSTIVDEVASDDACSLREAIDAANTDRSGIGDASFAPVVVTSAASKPVTPSEVRPLP